MALYLCNGSVWEAVHEGVDEENVRLEEFADARVGGVAAEVERVHVEETRTGPECSLVALEFDRNAQRELRARRLVSRPVLHVERELRQTADVRERATRQRVVVAHLKGTQRESVVRQIQHASGQNEETFALALLSLFSYL